MTENKVLIFESINTTFKEVLGNENFVVPPNMMLVEGVVGAVDTKNRNGRTYSRSEYERHVSKFNDRCVRGEVLGEMEHPQTMNINLKEVSHRMLGIRVDEDNMVRGQLLLLDTDNGLKAQSIVKSGAILPISSRATGIIGSNGDTVLEDLVTYDLVGTAGFEQAKLYQRKGNNTFENSQTKASLITESFIFNLNENGDIIDNQTNMEKTITIKESELDSIISAKVKEELEKKETEKVQEEKEDLIKDVDEKFEKVYAPAIENWLLNIIVPHVMENTQSWITNQYSAVFEKWVTEDVLTKNAEVLEKWVTEEFSQRNSKVTENWLMKDVLPLFCESLQGWIITEAFGKQADITESFIKNKLAEGFGKFSNVLEQHIDDTIKEEVKTTIVDIEKGIGGDARDIEENKKKGVKESEEDKENDKANESEEDKAKKEINESKTLFTSTILESIDKMVNKSLSDTEKANEDEKEDDKKEVNEALEFNKFAPNWLRGMPDSHKTKWVALNESQKEQVYRKASVRAFESLNDISRFWDSLNYESIINEGKTTQVLPRKIDNTVSNVNEDFYKGIINSSKALQNN